MGIPVENSPYRQQARNIKVGARKRPLPQEAFKSGETAKDRPTPPELDRIRRPVLNSLASVQSRKSYQQHAMNEFIDRYCPEPRLALNRGVVLAYRTRLESRHVAVAGIRHTKGVPQFGRRIGNWLTARQREKLLAAFNKQTLHGKRDGGIVSLLI
jgi:hypothetical protein